MYFVYSLQSKFNGSYYIGKTNDIERRLREHETGQCDYTADRGPWQLIFYVAFTEKEKADTFELYLKTGSGRAFIKRHL